jgi:hypothetical protein
MDATLSKWNVPCPMGKDCSHKHPTGCTTAYQKVLAGEHAANFRRMLSGWGLPAPRGNDGQLGQGILVDVRGSELVSKPDGEKD